WLEFYAQGVRRMRIGTSIYMATTLQMNDGANIQLAGNRLYLDSGVNIYSPTDTEFHVNTSGFNRFKVTDNAVAIYRNLDMAGYKIIGESDIRLKEHIEPTEINGIEETKKLGVVDFDWKSEHPVTKDYPRGRQLGI